MSKTQSSYSTEFPTLCWHLSIFPGRLQPSIFDTNELNFRVRYGNGCTLIAIDTNYSDGSLALASEYPEN